VFPIRYGMNSYILGRKFCPEVKITMRLTVSVSWCRAPSGAHDQMFVTAWHLQFCPCGADISDDKTGLSSFSHILQY
jgi:hypothetical protein